MSDRELKEFLVTSQVWIIRKINRIDTYLQNQGDFEEYIDGENRHHDQVYEDLAGKVDDVLRMVEQMDVD